MRAVVKLMQKMFSPGKQHMENENVRIKGSG
jgi:hypothetical protein